jgi:hypothetical protein
VIEGLPSKCETLSSKYKKGLFIKLENRMVAGRAGRWGKWGDSGSRVQSFSYARWASSGALMCHIATIDSNDVT